MAYIELEMWDVKYIPSGHIVDTGALGPCVGVIIYNPNGKDAYGGHFVDPQIDELETMIKDALRQFQISESKNNLEVYVVGNSAEIIDLKQREYELQSRRLVDEIFAHYGFCNSQIYKKWSPDKSVANLELQVDTGKTLLEIVEEDDFLTIIYSGEIKEAPIEIMRR